MIDYCITFPKAATYGSVVHKNKIFGYCNPSSRIRKLFSTEIEQIIWDYKLAPETINLKAAGAVYELQVFRIKLKTEFISDDVLRTIDRAVPSPVIYRLEFNDTICYCGAYKRPSEAEHGKWVIGDYMKSAWIPRTAPEKPLNIMLDLESLYHYLLRELAAQPLRPGEPMKAYMQRIETIHAKERLYEKLQKSLHGQKQFNKKVDINREMREIQHEIDALKNVRA